MNKQTFITTFLLFTLALTSCTTLRSAGTDDGPPAHSSYSFLGGSKPTTVVSVNDESLWQSSPEVIWYNLQHTSVAGLEKAQASAPDAKAAGWLSLAIISKKDSANTPVLVQELLAWRAAHPNHPGNELIPSDESLQKLLAASSPKQIAVLLPLHGPQAASGRIVRAGFLGAYYDSLGKSAKKQSVTFYDTSQNADISTLYQKAVADGANIVVGPLLKPEVDSLNHYNRFEVPVIALNYTKPGYFSSNPANFYEFGLSPVYEAKQMTNKAWSGGLKQALVIAPDDAWGHRVGEAATANWQSLGGTVSDSLYFNKQTNLTHVIASLLHVNPKADRALMREENKKSVLSEQRRQDFDVIFLFAQPNMARQIVPLLRFYYANNVPIYSISTIYSGRPNPSKDRDLDGVTFPVTPWVKRMAGASSSNPNLHDNLYAIGRDAYLLSQALPRLSLLPNFPVYGSTGALSLNQQRIHQRLPWVKMHGGTI